MRLGETSLSFLIRIKWSKIRVVEIWTEVWNIMIKEKSSRVFNVSEIVRIVLGDCNSSSRVSDVSEIVWIVWVIVIAVISFWVLVVMRRVSLARSVSAISFKWRRRSMIWITVRIKCRIEVTRVICPSSIRFLFLLGLLFLFIVPLLFGNFNFLYLYDFGSPVDFLGLLQHLRFVCFPHHCHFGVYFICLDVLNTCTRRPGPQKITLLYYIFLGNM
jgi:hypothetical protein